ncbi:MAG: hypothetical protein RIG62_23445 [Cyclobacteriaceae bacterium]
MAWFNPPTLGVEWDDLLVKHSFFVRHLKQFTFTIIGFDLNFFGDIDRKWQSVEPYLRSATQLHLSGLE